MVNSNFKVRVFVVDFDREKGSEMTELGEV